VKGEMNMNTEKDVYSNKVIKKAHTYTKNKHKQSKMKKQVKFKSVSIELSTFCHSYRQGRDEIEDSDINKLHLVILLFNKVVEIIMIL
jgi:hypothetical protein